LSSWGNFYVIVGSASAALIGIQFVVMTLIAATRKPTTTATIGAFGTPTVVYFGGALLVAALMSVPWPSLASLAIALGLCGLGGLGYAGVVIRRARRQTGYAPTWDDWLWYVLCPLAGYAALAVAALVLCANPQLALFIIGAAVLSLLLIAIRNAWDTMIHIVVSSSHGAAPNDPARTDAGSARTADYFYGKETAMDIKRSGSQPSGKGPADYFTGTVRIDPLFEAPEPARVRGASVTFEPGARTAWHTHPLGQTLIVTAGCGLAQRWGGPIEEIRPGDVIWFPPGEKHWHGATATTAMTHTAIQEQLDGTAVAWLEHVSDEQYQGAA
jgi:quercetin dioxygenase-like cupin family protein